MSRPFLPWRVVHVDLAGEVASLAKTPGEGGLFVAIWWRDLPLGAIELRPDELPVSASALRIRAAGLATSVVGSRLVGRGFRSPLPERDPPQDALPPLADLLSAAASPLHAAYALLEDAERAADARSVSVVVCTRGRPESLARCLDALARLAPAPDQIVVVDNDPADPATRRVVEGSRVQVHYVPEPLSGLSVARNAGLRASTGELVAFTDDDVEVHPRWVGRLRAAFRAPEVWAVTGLVLPAEIETEAQSLFERSQGGAAWGFQPRVFDPDFFARARSYGAPVWDVGAGANMAFRRRAFDVVGEFDPRLGAGASGCSEDSEMWYRILAAGGWCLYEPAAVVYHTHRRERAALRSQMRAYLRGHVTALLIQHERHGGLGNLRRAFVTLPGFYARQAVRRALGRGAGPPFLGAQIAGWAAGFGYYLRHRRLDSREAGPST